MDWLWTFKNIYFLSARISSIFINNFSLFEQRKIPRNEVNCTSQYHDWTTRFGQSQKRMWYEVWRNGLNHRAGQKIRRLGIRKRVIWNCSKRNWDSKFRGFVRKFIVIFLKERPKDWFYTNIASVQTEIDFIHF